MLSAFKSTIRTVTGDVSAEELGHVQCHEHIFLRKGPSCERNPALLMDDYGNSLKELMQYKAAGGDLIVDAQPGGFGRDGEILRRLSLGSGVKIVAVTGFHKLIFAEKNSAWENMKEDSMNCLFSGEIRQGMTDSNGHQTDIRAGLVKAALEEGSFENPVSHRLLRAVACTAADTGVAVLIHTEKDADVFRLIRFFEGYRVPARRLLICHLDRTRDDIGYHREVLKAGCMLCYDSVNRTKYVSHEKELALITAMCNAGFEGQLVLSLDTTNQRLRAYNAKDMGLDYILKDYIPMLRRAGITEKQIEKMCVENAKKILAIDEPGHEED